MYTSVPTKIKNYYRATLLVMVFLLGAFPAFATEVREDTDIEKILPGKWLISMNNSYLQSSFQVNYFADGSASGAGYITVEKEKNYVRYSTRWRVEEGKLVEEIINSDNPEFLSVGEVTEDKIVYIDDGLLKLRSKDGDIIVLQKDEPTPTTAAAENDSFDFNTWKVGVALGVGLDDGAIEAFKGYLLSFYRRDPEAMKKYLYPADLKKHKDLFIAVAKAMEPFGENDELYELFKEAKSIEELEKMDPAHMFAEYFDGIVGEIPEETIKRVAKSIVIEGAQKKGSNLFLRYSYVQSFDERGNEIRNSREQAMIQKNGQWTARFKKDIFAHLERNLRDVDFYYARKKKDRVKKSKKPKGTLEPFKVYGYRNEKGEVVIEPRFKDADDFKDGLAPVKVFKKYGYIDRKGDFAIDPKFNEARPFSGDLAVVGKYNTDLETLYGVMNKKGKMVVDFIYDDLNDFHEGLCAARKGEKWGFIDYKGDVVIDFKYGSAADFAGGKAEVELESDKGYITLLIDDKGKVLQEVPEN